MDADDVTASRVASLTGQWDYGVLPDNVWLGSDCYLESPRLLEAFHSTRVPGLVIGDRTRVCLGGWGGQFSVQPGGVVRIGRDCTLLGAQVMCLTSITLGDEVSIAHNAVIADSDFHPRDPLLRRFDVEVAPPSGRYADAVPLVGDPVVIEDGARIGINAIVLKGVRIGEGARVLAGTVVSKDVPPHTTVGGNPMRQVDAEDA